MKLSSALCVAGLVAGQAPDPQKTCTDCQAFGAAYKDEVKNNPGIIDQWCGLATSACDSAPPAYQNLCKSVADKALKNYLTNLDKEDPKEWCTHVTMCPNTKNFWVNGTTPKDCTACLNFMTDLQLIAINDPNHFAQFYKVVSTDICKGLGGFEGKICASEVGNFEEDARQAIASTDVNTICQSIMFCDQQ